MGKTQPIGVRFDEELLERLKKEGRADSPQTALNYLSEEFKAHHLEGNVVHIYKMINPITMKIFYVGKTERPPTARLWAHINETMSVKENSKSDKHIALENILKTGKRPMIRVVETIECQTEEDYDTANKREKYWIFKLLDEGVELVNGESKYPKYSKSACAAKGIAPPIVEKQVKPKQERPKTLEDIKRMCPKELTGIDRTIWINEKRTYYNV